MSTTVSYKGSTIATVNNNTKTLKTAGKYMEGDVTLVDVSAASPIIQSLSVTPSETAQTFNASGVDGYKPVSVSAISSTYVGSGIDRRDYTDLTRTLSETVDYVLPAGYYADDVEFGLTLNDSNSVQVSGATVTIPSGWYENQVTKTVASGSATGPSSLSASSATITTGTGTITLTKTGVTTTPTVSAGYVSAATASTATVALTASVTVNPTPTASGKTVTIPAGYYSAQTTKDVSTGSATGPSTVSSTGASVSTGNNTLTLTKNSVSITPTVSAGYISSGTASSSTVSLTASVTTKGATTYTPGTQDQTIASGTYLTGAQTISGDVDLVANNIRSGVQIFGVNGSLVTQAFYTGSSAPSSSLGSNGDIYLQQTGA